MQSHISVLDELLLPARFWFLDMSNSAWYIICCKFGISTYLPLVGAISLKAAEEVDKVRDLHSGANPSCHSD